MNVTLIHPLLNEYKEHLEEFGEPYEYMTLAEYIEEADCLNECDRDQAAYVESTTPIEREAAKRTSEWLYAIGEKCFETGDFASHHAALLEAESYYSKTLEALLSAINLGNGQTDS